MKRGLESKTEEQDVKVQNLEGNHQVSISETRKNKNDVEAREE